MNSLEGHSQLDIEHTLDRATPNCTPYPLTQTTLEAPLIWALLAPNLAYVET